MAELRLEEFSGGYYKAEMVAQPYTEGPAIERSLYQFIINQLYVDEELPPIFKFGLDGGSHFKPKPDPSLPPDVIAIPSVWFEEEPIVDDNSQQSVFIVKPQQSQYLRARFGGEVTSE